MSKTTKRKADKLKRQISEGYWDNFLEPVVYGIMKRLNLIGSPTLKVNFVPEDEPDTLPTGRIVVKVPATINVQNGDKVITIPVDKESFALGRQYAHDNDVVLANVAGEIQGVVNAVACTSRFGFLRPDEFRKTLEGVDSELISKLNDIDRIAKRGNINVTGDAAKQVYKFADAIKKFTSLQDNGETLKEMVKDYMQHNEMYRITQTINVGGRPKGPEPHVMEIGKRVQNKIERAAKHGRPLKIVEACTEVLNELRYDEGLNYTHSAVRTFHKRYRKEVGLL